LRESNLGAGGFAMFIFLVSLIAWSRWTSRVGGNYVIGADLLHKQDQGHLKRLYGVLRSFYGI